MLVRPPALPLVASKTSKMGVTAATPVLSTSLLMILISAITPGRAVCLYNKPCGQEASANFIDITSADDSKGRCGSCLTSLANFEQLLTSSDCDEFLWKWGRLQ
ncbi:hypothetical protein BDU57DRAFT_528297 [Ampelomyces quisqualis]|uniref:Uncharacterized protein n=1 Tax=Ampelomyces quisqualis TaxID=50730 RepID=A0A6A5QPS4_AMPQU|nr:hypothetical protein BDU57DRAFT_528297 [Ampelomyces quisqualis]